MGADGDLTAAKRRPHLCVTLVLEKGIFILKSSCMFANRIECLQMSSYNFATVTFFHT